MSAPNWARASHDDMRRVKWVRSVDRYIGVVALHTLSLLKPPRKALGYRRDKALVIKFAGMGDIILLKPVIDCIKCRLGNLKVHFLTSPAMSEIVEYLGLTNRGDIHEIDFGKCFSSPAELLALLFRLRRERFNIAIDFEQWMRISAIISFLAGAPLRYGFSTPGQMRHMVYTHHVSYSFEQHTLISFARLASEFVGNDIVAEVMKGFTGCVRPEMEKLEEMKQRLRSCGWHGNSQPITVIHPGCGRGGEPRTWLIERYAEVAHRLNSTGAFVVLTGGKDDEGIADGILHLAGCGAFANLVGKTSFAELVAIVSMAKLVICPNTGIMHLAAALGIPTVALHGPTNPTQWRPIGETHIVIQAKLKCVPCLRLGHDYGCADYKCMRIITVEEVWEAIEKLL